MEVIDIGRLIECIEERTFLWNEKNNHYRDRKARDMAWMEIGDEMFDNWSELSRTEKADKGKSLKEKWKHLKDSYARSIRLGHNNIYADSLYFLRDNFQQRKTSLAPKKNVSVKNKVQKNGHQASENSSSDSFQNTSGLSNTEPSVPQETSDCSSSDSIRNTNGPIKVQPSLSQGSSGISSSNSYRKTSRLMKSIVRTSSSPKTSKKAEVSPKQDKAEDFLASLLRDYRELSEDDKLDFRIMTLQYIRNARKKRNSQNQKSSTNSSQRSDPMQITPD